MTGMLQHIEGQEQHEGLSFGVLDPQVMLSHQQVSRGDTGLCEVSTMTVEQGTRAQDAVHVLVRVVEGVIEGVR